MAGNERDTVDASAWLCRALGNSGNNRYKVVLDQVADDKSVHRRLRGHCEKASKNLSKGATSSYVAGTVNLELLRNPPPPPPPPPPGHQGQEKHQAGRRETRGCTGRGARRRRGAGRGRHSSRRAEKGRPRVWSASA